MTKVLILAGLTNSGPKHWQSLWESYLPNLIRVNHTDWNTPQCNDWIDDLEHAVASKGEDVVLVAHSLACVLVAKWARKYPRKIKGALLVAPSDTEADAYPKDAIGFIPIPLIKLPFPSILVASTNDPYVSPERAIYFAEKWGAELFFIGERGHINSASNLGIWQQGLEFLSKLMNIHQ
jgi:predicted alpha/beta hydrolase family esterase